MGRPWWRGGSECRGQRPESPLCGYASAACFGYYVMGSAKVKNTTERRQAPNSRRCARKSLYINSIGPYNSQVFQCLSFCLCAVPGNASRVSLRRTYEWNPWSPLHVPGAMDGYHEQPDVRCLGFLLRQEASGDVVPVGSGRIHAVGSCRPGRWSDHAMWWF